MFSDFGHRFYQLRSPRKRRLFKHCIAEGRSKHLLAHDRPLIWELSAARSCFGIEKRSSNRAFQGFRFPARTVRAASHAVAADRQLGMPARSVVRRCIDATVTIERADPLPGRLHARSDCLSPRICKDRATLSLLSCTPPMRSTDLVSRFSPSRSSRRIFSTASSASGFRCASCPGWE